MPNHDYRSPEAQAYRRLYKDARWCGRHGRRLAHLASEPLCRFCLEAGRVNDGSRTMSGELQSDPRRRYLVVDHVIPHRGDEELFWYGSLQTLCPDHHDSVKQAQEARGFSTQAGTDGWPIDPKHPANR